MKNKFQVLVFLSMFFIGSTWAQINISGPSCVLPGIIYQYDIKANWDSAASANLCVIGGVIADSNKNCIKANALSYIRIIWDSVATRGIIILNTGPEKKSFNVAITTLLQPGNIDPAKKVQQINKAIIPSIIYCSLAVGGNCNPEHTYQWQQSYDNETWADVEGEIMQNLSLNITLERTAYFRRKVTEIKSGSFAYSGDAIVVQLQTDLEAISQ